MSLQYLNAVPKPARGADHSNPGGRMCSTTPASSEVVGEPPPDFGTHNMFAFGRETVFGQHQPS
jgi:hypothetical protein